MHSRAVDVEDQGFYAERMAAPTDGNSLLKRDAGHNSQSVAVSNHRPKRGPGFGFAASGRKGRRQSALLAAAKFVHGGSLRS